MARVCAVLGALWTAIRRDAKSIGSFTSNNFFLAGVIFLALKDPQAFVSLNFLIGIVLFFPLSTDPLHKIPRVRLAIWPLAQYEHRLLRLLSPWLNPVTWLLAVLAIRGSVTLGLWALIAALFLIGFVAPWIPRGSGNAVFRRLPRFPGPLNQLIRKNLRETLSTLDFYVALLLSGGALLFRASGGMPAEALLPLTVLVMLALSTNAQSLFGLDGDGGLTRYRLLPVRGWQILAAKDAAFLLTAVLLTLPLSPAGGLSAALAALAEGHYSSVNYRHEETRWRFSTSTSFGRSIFQLVVMTLAASATASFSALMLLPCAAAYAASAWWYGRTLERRQL
ncbi:MAG: hypothetical protein C5B51_23935 [Terriglobia bacterium]|nr:MAG: hypothetical protein C5B51_23935 [Terriglobia bacterium]